MSLTYGGLCEGYGGLTMGVQSVLGGELAWYSEFDKAPSKILAHHHPGVPNLGDMTKVDWSQVEPVDVLTGGTPCQDLSHAGKRAGMSEGTRSNLWVQMREAIAHLRPSLVVWENVRGAYSAEADSALEQCPRCVGDPRDAGPVLRALGRVLGDLSDLGYDAWWYGLRAADVGAAHGRFRVFVFATPADASGVRGFEAVQHDGRGAQAVHGSGVPDESDRDALRSGPVGVPGQLTLLPTPAVNDMGKAYTPETGDAWTARMQAAHGNGNGHGKSLNIEALRLLKTPTAQLAVNGGSQHPDKRKDGGHGPTLADEVEHLLSTPAKHQACDRTDKHRAHWHGPGSSWFCYGIGPDMSLLNTPTAADAIRVHVSARAREKYGATTLGEQVIGQDWREYAAAIARAEHATGRTAPPPTEPGTKGNPRLSPAFVEWLMMLPAGHVTDPAIDISRNDQLKALGNGVVPPQAAAATRAWLADRARQENVA